MLGSIGVSELFIILLILALSALPILVVIWLVMRLRGSRRESASDVLNRRYAAGEITKEQLDQMRGDITD